MYLSPAEFVINQFGGVCQAAKALKLHPTSVSNWRRYRHRRAGRAGWGGIPPRHLPQILKYARKHKLAITADDLILGVRVRRSR